MSERPSTQPPAGAPSAETSAGQGSSGQNGAPPAPPQGGAPSKRARHTGETGAPRWVVPVYLAGFVLVYLGERALSALETTASAFTWLGVALAVGSTLFRLHPRYRGRGSQRAIETTQLVLSVGGLVALAGYGLTTEAGAKLVGLESERALGVSSVAWMALLLLSLTPLVFAEIARVPMRRAERPESRRVLAAATSGAVLAAAAVYGSLFVFAADGVDLQVDYSYFKTSRPSESTRKVAASLEEDVQITAFFPEVNEVRNEVTSYLSDLSRGVPKLKVQVLDRLLEPQKARELRATQDGVVVVSKGTTHKSLTLGTEMKSARSKLKTLDRDFQDLLLQVARSRRTAYLTVGHGELNEGKGPLVAEGRDAQGVRQLLQRQNYSVKDLGLAQGLGNAVPDDAALVLVLGPTRPFAPEEIASLRRYAEGGGKLFLALDPEAPGDEAELDATALAGTLRALAEIVGLDLSPTLLAHDRQHVRRRFNDSDRVMLISSSFSSHASVSTLSRGAPRAAVVVSGAGSLEKAANAPAELKVDFAVRAPVGTFADADGDFQKGSDEPSKAYNLAAAVSRKGPEGEGSEKADEAAGPGEMRAFVLADVDAVSDLFLVKAPNNPLLFLDPVRWLGGEESFAGEVNVEEDVRIEHTKQGDQLWFYSTIFGAPALVLGVGLVLGRASRRSLSKAKAGGKA